MVNKLFNVKREILIVQFNYRTPLLVPGLTIFQMQITLNLKLICLYLKKD